MSDHNRCFTLRISRHSVVRPAGSWSVFLARHYIRFLNLLGLWAVNLVIFFPLISDRISWCLNIITITIIIKSAVEGARDRQAAILDESMEDLALGTKRGVLG